MTRSEVIRIAKEVYGEDVRWAGIPLQRMERLAKLFAAAEREECAKACDEFATIEGIAQKCAATIRARGQE